MHTWKGAKKLFIMLGMLITLWSEKEKEKEKEK
jgi:hypothetical protein